MTTAICISCGAEYDQRNSRQRRCKTNCQPARFRNRNSARTRQRRIDRDTPSFIGVDGEGVDRPDGQHDYVMLSVGNQTLTRPDGNRLTCHEIFPWLYDRYRENPKAIYIGFFLTYDFTQWTRDIPEINAVLLWSQKWAARRQIRQGLTRPVVIHLNDGTSWDIDCLSKRRFRLRPHICVSSRTDPRYCQGIKCDKLVNADTILEEKDSEIFVTDDELNELWSGLKKTWSPDLERWMYINDTGGFWQCSFLKAIDPSKWPHPVVTTEEYEIIREGKNSRARVTPYGDTSEYVTMMRYNILENEVLARVTTVLDAGFQSIEIKLNAQNWYGPGRAAHVWLNQVNRKLEARNTPEDTPLATIDQAVLLDSFNVPRWAFETAQRTYYGGWFEIFAHGHIPGTVWEYDINSAYPYEIARLPCLAHGKWTQGEGKPPRKGLSMAYVTAEASNDMIGPAPYRNRTGNILRPRVVCGWYWLPELAAANAAGLVKAITFHSWVNYIPCKCSPPLASIAALYAHRQSVDKNSPEGRAIKLLINSAYGKTAQSVGVPRFSNAVYASLITSGTRTAILNAIASHPNGYRDVVMVATDGVYFTSRHPNLKLKAELGAWEESQKQHLTLIMPGVYYDDKLRDAMSTELRTGKRAESLPSKTRGVNARDLAEHFVSFDLGFSVMHSTINDGGNPVWPVLEIPINFQMITPGAAINRHRWNLCGTVLHDTVRKVSSEPSSKRDTFYVMDNMIRSRIYDLPSDQIETKYYDRSFGLVELMIAPPDHHAYVGDELTGDEVEIERLIMELMMQ